MVVVAASYNQMESTPLLCVLIHMCSQRNYTAALHLLQNYFGWRKEYM